MVLKEKLKPLIFALSLILGIFVINGNVFASTTKYIPSSDYIYCSGSGVSKECFLESPGSPSHSLDYPEVSSWLYSEITSSMADTNCNYGQHYAGSFYARWNKYDNSETFVDFSSYGDYGSVWTTSLTCWQSPTSCGESSRPHGAVYFGTIYNYPSSGDYYLKIVPISTSLPFGCGSPADYDIKIPFHVDKVANTITLIEQVIEDGVCGTANNNLPTTIPIAGTEACYSGSINNLHESYSFNGIIYSWSCLGSGGGISVNCETLPYPNPINGVCGTANNTTVYNQPEESEKCSAGATNSTTLITLTGWAWVCEGLYGGTDASCLATYSGGGTPPTDPETSPIPTPTDCEAYSGIDKILCNLGNTIQGLFLPSAGKIEELQNTMNAVGDVFPFNYLRIIGDTFSNMNITSGTLTMTLWGNTETINPAFFDLPLFSKVKLFSTILILLMFTFWAIKYIKHFFK
ncbi:MAG: hypothetical protein WC428_08550 [Candidatus Paceibacterota bacterium]